MKKQLLLPSLLMLASFSFSGFSQSFFIHYDMDPGVSYSGATVTFSGDENMIDGNLYIENTGSESIDLKWERVVISHSSVGYIDQLCDGELCFNCFGNPWTRAQFYTIAAGDSTLFQPKLFFNGNGGTAHHRYYILDENEIRVDSVDVHFSSTVSISKLSSDDLQIFPNPSKGMLKIENIQDGVTIEISTILGKVVSQQTLSGGSQNIDLYHLTDGVYFINVLDTDGTLIKTSKQILEKSF